MPNICFENPVKYPFSTSHQNWRTTSPPFYLFIDRRPPSLYIFTFVMFWIDLFKCTVSMILMQHEDNKFTYKCCNSTKFHQAYILPKVKWARIRTYSTNYACNNCNKMNLCRINIFHKVNVQITHTYKNMVLHDLNY